MRYHHVSGQTKTVKKQTITYRATIFAIAGVFALTAVFGATNLPKTISADSYDNQISALQQQNASAQNQISQLALQAGSLQDAISALQSQQNDLQNQINSTQAKINDLNSQIAQTEQQIKDQSATLARTLATIYNKQQSSSTLDILMNSNSVSDYVDAMSQQNSMKNQMTTSIGKINDLKSQLQSKKNQAAGLLKDQQSQKADIVNNQAQQQKLMDETKGQESSYQNLVKQNNDQIAKLVAERAALDNKNHSTTIASSQCGGGYPFCTAAPDSSQSKGGFISSNNARECVNYVQWRIFEITGKNERHGDAGSWSDVANLSGPVVNSVAIMDRGSGALSYGHVAWVEEIGSGKHPGEVRVSQYNWNPAYGYSEQWVSISSYTGGFYKNW